MKEMNEKSRKFHQALDSLEDKIAVQQSALLGEVNDQMAKIRDLKLGSTPKADPTSNLKNVNTSPLQKEVQLLMKLNHPNIITIYEVVDSVNECFIVMEQAKGELIELITASGYLPEDLCRKYFRQLVSAIDHCHLANIVHRDLKVENILLDQHNNILVTDFGLGKTFNPNASDQMQTFCGTPSYAAVEMISGRPYCGVKTDIWAMGVVLYIMAAGSLPFKGSNLQALYRNIKDVKYLIPIQFSNGLVSVLRKILVKDPNQRISMNDLRHNPWVTNESLGPPSQIPPRIIEPFTEKSLADSILSISHNGLYTTYVINKSRHPTKLSLVKSYLSFKSNAQHDSKYQLRRLSNNTSSSSKKISNDSLNLNRLTISESWVEIDSMKPVTDMLAVQHFEKPPISQLKSDEIATWHSIHHPPKEIRPLKSPFQKSYWTSHLESSLMFQILHEALLAVSDLLDYRINFVRDPDYYIFNCTVSNGVDNLTTFDLELCRTLLFKTISLSIVHNGGDSKIFRNVVDTVISWIHDDKRSETI
ncbi:kinase-like domain-containing protein [Globomyces pollinis-pini]|nr:kinase-like domain-containing protein [Globomyces pollinis-pini]